MGSARTLVLGLRRGGQSCLEVFPEQSTFADVSTWANKWTKMSQWLRTHLICLIATNKLILSELLSKNEEYLGFEV